MQRKYGPEGIAASLLFVALLLVVLLQVTGRLNLFSPFVWTEELARWIWVWLGMIGLAEVERTNTHLRMTFLVDLIGSRIRNMLFLAFDFIWLAAMLQLLWVGYKTVARTWRFESVTLIVNDWVLYASFLVASIFISLRIVQRIGARITGQPVPGEME